MAASTTTTASGCPQCFFTAASTTLLAFPSDIATVSIELRPTVSIGPDARFTTYYETIFFTGSSTLSPAPTSTIYHTNIAQLTWTTLGTTLSAPTIYVHYLSFLGAAVTGSGCVSTLTPSTLRNPTSASDPLVYPLGVTSSLPGPILSYLDSQPDFIAQLGNRSLESCINVPLQTSLRTSAVSTTTSLSSILAPTTNSSAGASSTEASLPQPVNSLSGGASAGIGVGTAVGVILLVGLGILSLMRWRRRQREQSTSPTSIPEEKASSLYEADGTRSPPQELDPQFVAEMQQPLTELDQHAQSMAEL